MPKGIYAELPNWRQLQGSWEPVCRYIDAQPYRSVRYPYPPDPPMSTRLFKRMAQFKLVKHGDDCSWRLTRNWQAILTRLWKHLPEEDLPKPATEQDLPPPFVADTGVDTMYISLLAEELPPHVQDACTDLKALAQAQDASVETSWHFFGAPLSMYKSGVGTKEKGKGASWGYILRNDQVMVLVRKAPLNGIIASVRLSAEVLWRRGPRQALDDMRTALRRMWMDPKAWQTVTFQLSQIHLCADVANFVLQPQDLTRIVARSRKKQVHIPSSEDEAAAFYADLDDDAEYTDAWDVPDVPDDWLDVPLEDEFADDDEEETTEEDDDPDEEAETEDDEDLADTEGAVVHLWGERASGFAFSLKAPLSATWYNKALEERIQGKKLSWMQPIHQAGGWQPGTPLTRIEARFKREVLRELVAELGDQIRNWTDDPWLCLEHLNDLWAYFAGLPPEHDHAPDVTGRGWMRLAVPNPANDRKRSWPTDPTWHIIQRAPFTDQKPVMLKRVKHTFHDLDHLDAELYGLLKARTVMRETKLTTQLTLSQELHAFADRMEEIDAEKNRDYAEEVREKARRDGKPVPMRPLSMLMFTDRPQKKR